MPKAIIKRKCESSKQKKMTQNWQGNSNKNNIWLSTKVMDATKRWDNVSNMLTEKYVNQVF